MKHLSTIERPLVIRFRVSRKEREAFLKQAEREVGRGRRSIGDWIRIRLRDAVMDSARVTGEIVDL